MISSLKSIILIFLIDVSSFVIKDRATGKYLAAKIDGKISAKPRLSQASKFKIFPNGKSIIDFAVMDKKTKKMLDYSGSGPDLIAYNYHGGKNQLFEFNLDENGLWQIIQNKVKYLYWDPHEEKFMGDKYDPETHHGFLLFQDDGVTPFPIHKNSEPVIPRFSSPYDIASPFDPFMFSRNPFLVPRSSFGFNSFSGGE